MKFKLEERVKHRIVGVVVIISLVVVFFPAVMKQSKHQFDEKVNIAARLPEKPVAPKVAIPDEKKLLKRIKVAAIDKDTSSEIARMPQTVKAQPLHKSRTQIAAHHTRPTTGKKVNKMKKTKTPARHLDAKKGYAVQLASFLVENNAVALVKKLHQKGYKASYNKAVNQKGQYYKVIVGQAGRPEDAKKLQKQLAENVKLQGLVIKTGVS